MPINAKILLGWMERDTAVKFLTDDCVFDPPIDELRAEAIWRSYRTRVEELPEREASAPQYLALTDRDKEAADRFLTFFRSRGGAPNIIDVIKVDGRRLVAWQNYVNLERAKQYMEHAQAETWCARNTLALPRNAQNQLQMRSGPNCIDVSLPHGEFVFGFVPRAGFQVQENARHVSVTAYGERLLLWAGYHRSYARIASANPDGIECSLLVALTTDADFIFSPASPNQGLRAMLCGLRPPLLGDFLDDTLFMSISLRRKRYELHIRAQVVPVNDE